MCGGAIIGAIAVPVKVVYFARPRPMFALCSVARLAPLVLGVGGQEGPATLGHKHSKCISLLQQKHYFWN